MPLKIIQSPTAVRYAGFNTIEFNPAAIDQNIWTSLGGGAYLAVVQVQGASLYAIQCQSTLNQTTTAALLKSNLKELSSDFLALLDKDGSAVSKTVPATTGNVIIDDDLVIKTLYLGIKITTTATTGLLKITGQFK